MQVNRLFLADTNLPSLENQSTKTNTETDKRTTSTHSEHSLAPQSMQFIERKCSVVSFDQTVSNFELFNEADTYVDTLKANDIGSKRAH